MQISLAYMLALSVALALALVGADSNQSDHRKWIGDWFFIEEQKIDKPLK